MAMLAFMCTTPLNNAAAGILISKIAGIKD
jgi:hypothetical protein